MTGAITAETSGNFVGNASSFLTCGDGIMLWKKVIMMYRRFGCNPILGQQLCYTDLRLWQPKRYEWTKAGSESVFGCIRRLR